MDGAFGLGFCAASLVVCIALAVLSIGSVPPLTYGIKYNKFWKTADLDHVHEGGRYLIFPWSKFLLFPSAVQTLEFTNEPRLLQSGVRYPKLHTRTKDGLVLYLQVSLQYRLIRDKVGLLYAEFNQNYEQIFISSIRDILMNAAAEYEAFQLWEERAEVGARMQNMVNTALGRTYAECWGLQLMVIDLPPGFEESIVRTQVWEQRITSCEFEQRAIRVRAETEVIASEYARLAKVILAFGRADYSLTTKKASAEAKRNTLAIEARILNSVHENLELDGDEIVSYQRFASLKNLPNASVFYAFKDDATLFLPGPSPGTGSPDATARRLTPRLAPNHFQVPRTESDARGFEL